MAQHIVLMNLAAPLLALALPQLFRSRFGRSLPLATLVQLCLVWAWHAPAPLAAAMESPALHLVMQASLFLGALWFWCAVLAVSGPHRWKPIFALLVTGKLFCLLGVLLTFSPRLLHAGIAGAPTHADLADQQLAGLLMILACPATYVLAAVIIASRWLLRMESGERRGSHA
jgi:putative membrane protein